MTTYHTYRRSVRHTPRRLVMPPCASSARSVTTKTIRFVSGRALAQPTQSDNPRQDRPESSLRRPRRRSNSPLVTAYRVRSVHTPTTGQPVPRRSPREPRQASSHRLLHPVLANVPSGQNQPIHADKAIRHVSARALSGYLYSGPTKATTPSTPGLGYPGLRQPHTRRLDKAYLHDSGQAFTGSQHAAPTRRARFTSAPTARPLHPGHAFTAQGLARAVSRQRDQPSRVLSPLALSCPSISGRLRSPDSQPNEADPPEEAQE